MRQLRAAVPILVLLACALVLLAGVDPNAAAPGGLKEYFVRHGVQETGAANLVSAIYLGYRVYDTLGETLALVLAVTGAVAVLGRQR